MVCHYTAAGNYPERATPNRPCDVASLSWTPSIKPTPVAVSMPLQYYPLATPFRLVDTRLAIGKFSPGKETNEYVCVYDILILLLFLYFYMLFILFSTFFLSLIKFKKSKKFKKV